jgi:hypothetical protein
MVERKERKEMKWYGRVMLREDEKWSKEYTIGPHQVIREEGDQRICEMTHSTSNK